MAVPVAVMRMGDGNNMESWIRYSVAVYVGLLLAGAAMYTNDVQLGPAASADTGWYYALPNPEAVVTAPAALPPEPPHEPPLDH